MGPSKSRDEHVAGTNQRASVCPDGEADVCVVQNCISTIQVLVVACLFPVVGSVHVVTFTHANPNWVCIEYTVHDLCVIALGTTGSVQHGGMRSNKELPEQQTWHTIR